MPAKRSLILLGPGLLASLTLSPVIAGQASAAPAPAQTAVTAPSTPDRLGGEPPPDPNADDLVDPNYKKGSAAGISQAKKDIVSKTRTPVPVPSAKGHTYNDYLYYQGFRDGYQGQLAHHAATEQNSGLAVHESMLAATREGREAIQQRYEQEDRERQELSISIRLLMPPEHVEPPTTVQETAPQGQQTGSQGITKPTTPTHRTGQETAPQGQHTGSQGITEPTTPTRETGQETAPQGQDTGWQGMTESTPSEWGGWEAAPQGQDTGSQGMTESSPSEWGGWG
ncbi:hypothetical protein [Streptomyces sp. NPDC005181]|uniref:hypothetical protein n=1 Tax=Streptomyces sp. NPDC005181 TaxID=3156869 RepID=UPI0033BE87DD